MVSWFFVFSRSFLFPLSSPTPLQNSSSGRLTRHMSCCAVQCLVSYIVVELGPLGGWAVDAEGSSRRSRHPLDWAHISIEDARVLFHGVVLCLTSFALGLMYPLWFVGDR